MSKIPDCDRCTNNAHSACLVCAIHPKGVSSDSCPDFTGERSREELWCPDGYTFDDQQQLVKLPVTYETDHVSKLTRAQQYQIFMTHPMFTGMCPQCHYVYEENRDSSSWDYTICRWEA